MKEVKKDQLWRNSGSLFLVSKVEGQVAHLTCADGVVSLHTDHVRDRFELVNNLPKKGDVYQGDWGGTFLVARVERLFLDSAVVYMLDCSNMQQCTYPLPSFFNRFKFLRSVDLGV